MFFEFQMLIVVYEMVDFKSGLRHAFRIFINFMQF